LADVLMTKADFPVSITRSDALNQEWLAERRAKRDAAEAVSLTDEKPQRRRK
jgi:hypothetical protein